MSGDFFQRLESELGGLTRQGTHLDGIPRRAPNRGWLLLRRSVVIAALALALGAALVSEFPSSAGGQILMAQIPAVHGFSVA